MPAILPFGFYQGSRSEYLLTYLLSRLCVTVPVPRQSDFGIDYVCHLATREGNRLVVGLPFSVQTKTDGTGDIGYPAKPSDELRPAEVQWILSQSIPFLIAMVSRNDQRVRLYSTWQLHQLRYARGHEFSQIVLIPETDDRCPSTSYDAETRVGTASLGRPILDFGPDDVEELDRADELATVLKHWVELDFVNCVNNSAGICYIRGHTEYSANQKPGSDPRPSISFGHESLPGFRKRLAEVLTITGHAVEHTGSIDAVRPLREALEFVSSDLDPMGQALLQRLRST